MVSLGGIARKIFGSSNDRRVKKIRIKVKDINALEAEISALSDANCRPKPQNSALHWRPERQSMIFLIPAFAVAREACQTRRLACALSTSS